MTGSNQLVTEEQKKEDGTLQTTLHTIPPILFIQLKRFAYSVTSQTIQKINDFFPFPLELSLSPYTDQPDQSTTYVLRSVFIHGGSISSGHYYSYVCTQTNENAMPTKWCMFNDDHVEEVPLETVFEHGYGQVNTLSPSSKPSKTSKRGKDKDTEEFQPPADELDSLPRFHSKRREGGENSNFLAEERGSERALRTRPSRLSLRGGRDQFTMDRRTTSAYMLVYVKKDTLQPQQPTTDEPPSSFFIHRLLLIDMKMHLKEYYEMEGINLHLYSMDFLDRISDSSDIRAPTPLVKQHWKKQPLSQQLLEGLGNEMGIPPQQQDWWLMRKSPISGKMLPTQRLQKRDMRESSIVLVESYGFSQSDIALYCRNSSGLDFTTSSGMNVDKDDYLVILKIPYLQKQWCDVLVDPAMTLSMFCSKVHRFLGRVGMFEMECLKWNEGMKEIEIKSSSLIIRFMNRKFQRATSL